MHRAASVVAVSVLGSVCMLAQKRPALPPKLSPAVKVQLRIAFAAVRDLQPMADRPEYEAQDADAHHELRVADAMAESKDERRLVEHIGTYLLLREGCRTETTIKSYEDCEDEARSAYDWQTSYALGLTDKRPPN